MLETVMWITFSHIQRLGMAFNIQDSNAAVGVLKISFWCTITQGFFCHAHLIQYLYDQIRDYYWDCKLVFDPQGQLIADVFRLLHSAAL